MAAGFCWERGEVQERKTEFYLWVYQREETQGTLGCWLNRTRATNPKQLFRAEKSSLDNTISLDTSNDSHRLSGIASQGQNAYAVTSLVA